MGLKDPYRIGRKLHTPCRETTPRHVAEPGRDRTMPADRFSRLGGHPGITSALHAADKRLARFRMVRRNLIRLVWGFDKPGNAG